MAQYDLSHYYIDFSERTDLSNEDKNELENIQKNFRPIERIDMLTEFRVQGKITSDEFETMTGLPYSFGQ